MHRILQILCLGDFWYDGRSYDDLSQHQTCLRVDNKKKQDELLLKNRPGVIMIHGGGWVEGDKESMVAPFAVPFVQHGFVVANVEYRLAKSATAPAAVQDVRNAAKWFVEHAAEYKVDPGHVIVMGPSAGGHLALLTAMLPESAGSGQPSSFPQ